MRSRFERISALVTAVLAPALWIAGILIGQALTDKLPNKASDARCSPGCMRTRTS